MGMYVYQINTSLNTPQPASLTTLAIPSLPASQASLPDAKTQFLQAQAP